MHPGVYRLRKDHGDRAATVIAMKDFSKQPRVVEFKISPDIFRGKPFLAAQTMIDFTLKVDQLGEDITAEQGFDTMKEALQLVMMPEHYVKFIARMRSPKATDDQGNEVDLPVDPNNPPIELPQVNEILEYLMGEYGMRPPTSAEGSSTSPSSQGAGTNSTEEPSHMVSISSNSQQTSS